MRSIEFSYTLFHGLYLPIIPIQFKMVDRWNTYPAYVDSGATYSIFSIDVAETLNLNLEKTFNKWFLTVMLIVFNRARILLKSELISIVI